MGDNLLHDAETDIISRAIENVDQDTELKSELANVTADFLSYSRLDVELPTLDNVMHHQIIALAKFGARIRGTVSRDNYRSEMMMGRPFAEVGTRLGTQLAKIARSLALVRGKSMAEEDEYRVVRKIMLDTVSQRNEDIVRAILKSCPTEQDYISTADLAIRTRYPMTTVRRILDDMNMLDVVLRRGSGYKHSWTLSPYIRKAIHDSGLYQNPAERDRVARVVFRLRRKGVRTEQPG
jgi:hypothetical protein